jgi:hypothetical protein
LLTCKQLSICVDLCTDQTGLLSFQLQTGAVGHGEYFFLSFDNVTSTTTSSSSSSSSTTGSTADSSSALQSLAAEATRQTTAGDAPLRPFEHQQPAVTEAAAAAADAAAAEVRVQTGFSTDVLRCEQYWHPGSEHAPFPNPPPQQNLTSCGYVALHPVVTNESAFEGPVVRDTASHQ